MNWEVTWELKGFLYFIFVPIWLWCAGTLFIRRNEKSAAAFAFIAGGDNRLSLARLQAFAWTLVIFGSFVAAMAIHTKISPVTEAQAIEYKSVAKIAAEQVEIRKSALEKAKIDAKSYADKKDLAAIALQDAEEQLRILPTDVGEDLKKQKNDAVSKAKTEMSFYTDRLTTQNETVNNTTTAVGNAANLKIEADTRAGNYNWVIIPGALLLLAGIAISSGIFSSIISAVNSEEKTACLSGIEYISQDKFNEADASRKKINYPDTINVKSDNLLRIIGKDMDGGGKVRFGKGRISSVYAATPFWKSDGTEIIVNVPPNSSYDTIVVDTPNGKLSHNLVACPAKKANFLKTNLAIPEANVKSLEDDKKVVDSALALADKDLKELLTNKADTEKIEAAKTTIINKQSDVENRGKLLDAAKAEVKKINDETNNPNRTDTRILELGEYRYFYEFSDLFRDDKNPMNMDLMKFQMFGWTVVAIAIYSYLFLSNLDENTQSLPLVPESIVILTGLSQVGYLAGKGVSNIKPNPNPTTQN